MAARIVYRQRFNGLGASVVETFNLTGIECTRNAFEVAVLGPREFVAPIQDDDRIVIRERERVLDRRVARADHDNRLVLIFVGIVELVLHLRQIVARHLKLAQVALEADGDHHVLGQHFATINEFEREVSARALDRGHLSPEARLGAALGDTVGPGLQNSFAGAGFERDRRAQRQHPGLGHHMLALLITIDRVGDLGGRFEQHMRGAGFRRASRRAQAAWSGANDSDGDFFSHH